MPLPTRYAAAVVSAIFFLLPASAFPAQSRIAAIDATSTVALPGTVNPRAAAKYDTGEVAPSAKISGVTIYFQPTAEQQAAEDALVKAQQTPGSGQYHQWLTPAQWSARFGMSDSDLAKVEAWLEEQGFSIDRVSASRNSISFSGSAAQIESAFQTELHHYSINGETHFANATAISVPSPLAGVVRSLRNLDDFRPQPFVRFHPSASNSVKANFTSGQNGDHYLTPKDVATIYDINAAYNAGYTGTGQTIAIVGQSAVEVSDIEAFQSAAGLTAKAPTLILVPDSGTSAVSSGDEAESDIDLEYSSGIAKGATIDFVYVGNNQNYSVFDSIQYAIDEDLAPIISVSYGDCESDLGSSNYAALNGILEQGASQGQSIIAASGDDGSTACFGNTDQSTSQQEALEVNFPASSQYATGLGGTEFPAADVAASNTTYWESTSGSDVISSALSWIPEVVWNDDISTEGAEYALSSGGGGVSTFTARPSWQTNVTGIPSGSYRLVPDISLDSSPNNAGYLYCTSDTSGWSSGQKASCNSGFRDSSSQYLTIAGGTSFAAPIFAGMMAIINQKASSTSQGVAASTLYSLAASSSVYASAFHDISSGTNACTAGSKYCSTAGESEYAATTGYDEASGLGSVDLYNLLTSWPTTTSTGTGISTGAFTLSATALTITAGSAGTSTLTVTPTGGFTGTVNLTCAVTTSLTSVTDAPTCSLGSSSVDITGTSAVTATVNITTTASAALRDPLHRFFFPIGGAALAFALFFGIPSRRRGWQAMLGLLLLAISLAPLACGNSGSASSSASTPSTGSGGTTSGTTNGAYKVTVTGTSASDSSVTASTTFSLTVN
jgi:subtilase family serine protease